MTAFAIWPRNAIRGDITVYYMLIGGGGGGSLSGAGGGAGGLITGTLTLNITTLYSAIIGAGGLASGSTASSGVNGSNTYFCQNYNYTSPIVNALGGGGGGGRLLNGLPGGSGGGAGGRWAAGTSYGGASLSGQGYQGGDAYWAPWPYQGKTYGISAGGGGGGAGGYLSLTGRGGDNDISAFPPIYMAPGNGGYGRTNYIVPQTVGQSTLDVTYAGGGGGGAPDNGPGGYNYPGAVGGAGGGGSGAGGWTNAILNGVTVRIATASTPGVDGKGGGGGGGAISFDGAYSAAASRGGSGTLILSYFGPKMFNGGIVSLSGANTVHKFTTSGTLTPL